MQLQLLSQSSPSTNLPHTKVNDMISQRKLHKHSCSDNWIVFVTDLVRSDVNSTGCVTV